MTPSGKCASVFACAVVVLLSCSLQAAEKCPVEVKILLSPPMIQTVIASLGFEDKAEGQVYFYDTDKLELLRQGVIVRVRKGADNDLTVKVRMTEHDKNVSTSRLNEQFPCEIDRTGTEENISYSVRHNYKVQSVPGVGTEIFSMLSPPQKLLLQQVPPIEWTHVTRIANIKSTKWESKAHSGFRKLALELWEWPGGDILELSTKVGPGAGQSTSTQLQALVKMKGLSLNTRQSTKTRMVLEAITKH